MWKYLSSLLVCLCVSFSRTSYKIFELFITQFLYCGSSSGEKCHVCLSHSCISVHFSVTPAAALALAPRCVCVHYQQMAHNRGAPSTPEQHFAFGMHLGCWWGMLVAVLHIWIIGEVWFAFYKQLGRIMCFAAAFCVSAEVCMWTLVTHLRIRRFLKKESMVMFSGKANFTNFLQLLIALTENLLVFKPIWT